MLTSYCAAVHVTSCNADPWIAVTAASVENGTQLATQSAVLYLHWVVALQEDTVGSAIPAWGNGSAGGVLWLEVGAGPESLTGILQLRQHGC